MKEATDAWSAEFEPEVPVPSRHRGARYTEFTRSPDDAGRRGLAAHYGIRAYKQAIMGNGRNAVAFARAAAHHALEAVGRIELAGPGGRRGNEGQEFAGSCSCGLL